MKSVFRHLWCANIRRGQWKGHEGGNLTTCGDCGLRGKKPEYDHLTVAHWTQIYEDARMFMLGNKGSVSVLFSSNYDASGKRQHLAVSVSL